MTLLRSRLAHRGTALTAVALVMAVVPGRSPAVVGDTGTQARAVAEAIVHDAFHNVAFFDGGVSDVPELVARDP